MPVYNSIIEQQSHNRSSGPRRPSKTLRDELRLCPGDTLDLTVKGDEVTLRPRPAATPLQKERGVWVFRTGKPLTAAETEETLRNIRAQRNRQNAGESR